MLNFKELNNILIITAHPDMVEELKECENCIERENLIREYYHASAGDYDYKTADEIDGNLSEAPMFCSELNYSDEGNVYYIEDSDSYYYAAYAIADFTEKLMLGEFVRFIKL